MFTAIRRTMGESVYAYDIGNEYVPHHHHIFIKHQRNWGYVFRFQI
jgi:hypothetical protein